MDSPAPSINSETVNSETVNSETVNSVEDNVESRDAHDNESESSESDIDTSRADFTFGGRPQAAGFTFGSQAATKLCFSFERPPSSSFSSPSNPPTFVFGASAQPDYVHDTRPGGFSFGPSFDVNPICAAFDRDQLDEVKKILGSRISVDQNRIRW